jgi:hypothetical protein
VTRSHHALEGKLLEVFGKLRLKGKFYLVLVLPDGSRSNIPAAWTDFQSAATDASAPSSSGSVIASALDLLRTRQCVDSLLRRIEQIPTSDKTSPNQESQHETSTTRAVVCRTPSDPAALSTTHSRAAEQSGRSSGPTHSENSSSNFIHASQPIHLQG